MKNWIITISLLLMTYIGTYAQNNGLNGAITYKNTFNSAMHDSTIVYLMHNNTIMYFDTVDINGLYHFSNILPGNYLLKAVSYKKVGGISLVDYLIIFVNFYNSGNFLNGLNKKAADVNDSGGVPNAVDALAIRRYIDGAIPNFNPYSPWISETFNISVVNGNIFTQNIKMICRGDVNGSFIPY